MREEILAPAISITGKITASSGIFTMVLHFFSSYAAGIGAMCTVLTLIVYTVFNILSHIKSNESKENKVRLDYLEKEMEDSERSRTKDSEEIKSLIKSMKY